MPTYEYACTDCGTHIEVFQRMAADPLTTCGVCGGRLRKVFHPAGVLLKGSGFYKTDNRPKSDSSDGSGAAGPGPAKGSGKKESAATGTSKEKPA
jgi:putative FmdB family regulatory protein